MISESKKNVRFEATNVKFYSDLDEAAFFDWIGKVPAVEGSEGKGRTIFLTVDTDSVDDEALRELIAIFYRYGVSMEQLAVLDERRFAHWFRDKEAYWYRAVFES